MKTVTASLLAAALIAPALGVPALAQPAPDGDRDRGHEQHRDQDRDRDRPSAHPDNQGGRAGAAGHGWRKGQRFDRSRASHYAVLDYRKYKRLGPPPRGYHYVRSGNDILLVAITSGVIASVIANQFQ